MEMELCLGSCGNLIAPASPLLCPGRCLFPSPSVLAPSGEEGLRKRLLHSRKERGEAQSCTDLQGVPTDIRDEKRPVESLIPLSSLWSVCGEGNGTGNPQMLAGSC